MRNDPLGERGAFQLIDRLKGDGQGKNNDLEVVTKKQIPLEKLELKRFKEELTGIGLSPTLPGGTA